MGGVNVFVRVLFEYIFPSFCLLCEREGSYVCATCIDTLDCAGVFCCPVCHTSRVDGECCTECLAHASLSGHIAMVALTDDSLMHRMIHAYKYQYVEEMERVFDTIITRFFLSYTLPSVDYLIPVPLHRRRLVDRGFNQSERLGQMISVASGVPMMHVLKRIRNTKKQSTLDKSARQQNISGAFAFVDNTMISLLRDKHVVLVDDVYTTGSTINACAEVLRGIGVASVRGLSIARGDFSK